MPLPRIIRSAGHRARELALWPHLIRRGERVVFLPPDGRQMSSLLRGYHIAERLNAAGWNAAVMPKQLEPVQRRRFLRLFKPRVAVLMGSRHPDNGAALLDGIPYLYDLDDADFHDPKIEDRVCRDVTAAQAVIAGSTYVAEWCRRWNSETSVIWTGSPEGKADYPPQAGRDKIVAWAQSAPLSYPAELDFLVSILSRLGRSDYTLRLYGCTPDLADHAALAPLRELGVTLDLQPFMAYDAFIRSLSDIAVGLSPVISRSAFSRGKSFGKILAYLSSGVPIVTSDEADHALFFKSGAAVVTNDADEWVRAISVLLDDPERRQSMVDTARAAFEQRLTTQVAADLTEKALRRIIEPFDSRRKTERAGSERR